MRGVPWLLFSAWMCVWAALLASWESGTLWGWCAAAWGVVAGMSLADAIRRVAGEEE